MTVSRLWLLALAAFAATGCDEGRQNPPDVAVRVLNVAPGYPELFFRREQTSYDPQGGLTFQSAAREVYDEDTYDFYVDERDLATGRILANKWSFRKEIVGGTVYTFVLVQVGSEVQPVILEADPPAQNSTSTQVYALHAAEGVPALDIFFEAPGTDILGAVPWGTVSFLGTLPPRTVPPGDYEITVTEAGNRANVLLRSGAFGLGAPESTAFVIASLGGEGIAPISVVGLNSGGGVLSNANAQAAVRVINGADDGAPRDVAFGGEFSPPLFSAVPSAAPTAYAQRAPGTEVQVNVTPAGNPGVLEVDQKINLTATRKHTMLVSGPTGTLTAAYITDDDRRLLKGAQLRSYNAASQFAALDFLVIPADVDPTAAGAVASLSPGTIGLPANYPPGDYNIWLRQFLTTTIVAGPVPVTMTAAGIFGVLATNGPDAATATITLVDDFAP